MAEFAVKEKSAGKTTDLDKGFIRRENRTGIPSQLKARMERSTGLSFDDVRVNYNSSLPAKLDALAYTKGNQVEIGPGQEQHLPHELGHVVQQKLGLVRANARHSSGVALNTDAGLERQADEIGAGKKVAIEQRMGEEVVQRCGYPPGSGSIWGNSNQRSTGRGSGSAWGNSNQRSTGRGSGSAWGNPNQRSTGRGSGSAWGNLNQQSIGGNSNMGAQWGTGSGLWPNCSIQNLQIMANNVARKYNLKNRPYDNITSKGYRGIIRTFNGGVSFANSEYIYKVNNRNGQRLAITTINLTGRRQSDFRNANQQVGISRQPAQYTWHHVDDYNVAANCCSMELVPTPIHDASKPHAGACAQYDEVHVVAAYDPKKNDKRNSGQQQWGTNMPQQGFPNMPQQMGMISPSGFRYRY